MADLWKIIGLGLFIGMISLSLLAEEGSEICTSSSDAIGETSTEFNFISDLDSWLNESESGQVHRFCRSTGEATCFDTETESVSSHSDDLEGIDQSIEAAEEGIEAVFMDEFEASTIVVRTSPAPEAPSVELSEEDEANIRAHGGTDETIAEIETENERRRQEYEANPPSETREVLAIDRENNRILKWNSDSGQMEAVDLDMIVPLQVPGAPVLPDHFLDSQEITISEDGQYVVIGEGPEAIRERIDYMFAHGAYSVLEKPEEPEQPEQTETPEFATESSDDLSGGEDYTLGDSSTDSPGSSRLQQFQRRLVVLPLGSDSEFPFIVLENDGEKGKILPGSEINLEEAQTSSGSNHELSKSGYGVDASNARVVSPPKNGKRSFYPLKKISTRRPASSRAVRAKALSRQGLRSATTSSSIKLAKAAKVTASLGESSQGQGSLNASRAGYTSLADSTKAAQAIQPAFGAATAQLAQAIASRVAVAKLDVVQMSINQFARSLIDEQFADLSDQSFRSDQHPQVASDQSNLIQAAVKSFQTTLSKNYQTSAKDDFVPSRDSETQSSVGNSIPPKTSKSSKERTEEEKPTPPNPLLIASVEPYITRRSATRYGAKA